ncbi:MAG: ATP-binding protein [Bryobacteraceae bacterium]|nr:ATP-binding protein [Bryobacteraceae bacterium]
MGRLSMTDYNSAVRTSDMDKEQLREELDAARRKLAEAYKLVSIGRLVTGIVHEINTPIGSILSNNEVTLRSLVHLKNLLTECNAPERAHDIVETISSLAAVDKLACERISSVIRSLKTFSRVDEGDLRMADLNEILRNTLKLSGCEFRRRIRVETDFGDIPEIECHPQLLSQVFLNLLVNAGQAIEGEGDVRVRTWRDEESAYVTVADTGHGIKPQDRARIFATGFSTKPIGVGTGLGLAMAREIVVDTHRGDIRFESEVGVGTTFHVRLPLRQRPEAAE